nr:putative steroidogenic factor 1 [Macoploma tenta]
MAPTHNLHSAMNEIPQTSISLAQSMKVRSPHSRDSSVRSTNTLQSVLRGEIPSAYVHLTSQRQGGESSHNQMVDYRGSPVCDRLSNGTVFNVDSSERFIPSPHPSSPQYVTPSGHPTSPQYVTSAQALSPHPASPRESETQYVDSKSIYGNNGSPYHDGSMTSQFYERCSPAYDSRSSPFSESGSPFINRGPSPYYHMDSPYHSCSPHSGSPYYAPQSPGQLPQSPYTSEGYSSDVQDSFISEDKPIDLSCKSDNSFDSNEQMSGLDCTQNGSLLRNLLSSGKQKQLFGCHENSDRDSPCSDIYKPEVPVTGATRVTLAKKMIHPITSRVSDWLVKIVQFAKSIPEFSSLSHNDKVTLVINSWTRILLLLMAENEFEFAVTPLPADRDSSDVTPSADEPTMKSVESLQSFIKKCKNMSLDQKEYALLRMAVLFNSGYVGLDDTELIEKLNSAVQQLLQQHVTASRPGDVMHYSRILMCLPSLYGINCKMIEKLFCRRLSSNLDMQVLLKEMLQTL